MHYLITGAGQIGTQLAGDLASEGHAVTVLRRSDTPLPTETSAPGSRITRVRGDAADRELLRRLASGAAGIFHCVHASYSAPVWRRELPHREIAVMDVAAELDVPVVFPESVYAFGRGVHPLTEQSAVAPVTPLGRVRAELLASRSAHRARTASVVAGDLLGPTSTGKGSALLATVLDPVRAGRRAWVMGDPDAPHAATYLPDLTRAMVAAASLASPDDTVLLAPSPEPLSQRQLAAEVARRIGVPLVGVIRIPSAVFAAGAPFSAATRELFHLRYLWESPSSLRPGRLITELGLQATAWSEILDSTLGGQHT